LRAAAKTTGTLGKEADWLATSGPALPVRGTQNRLTSREGIEEMAARRPNTRMLMLGGGHVVHVDNAAAFNEAGRRFL
jgi:pimeloyl-ACP methyl ester carboxylesterase